MHVLYYECANYDKKKLKISWGNLHKIFLEKFSFIFVLRTAPYFFPSCCSSLIGPRGFAR